MDYRAIGLTTDPLMEVPTSTKGHNSVITKNLSILKAMQNLLQIIHKEREALSTGTCICIDSLTLFFFLPEICKDRDRNV